MAKEAPTNSGQAAPAAPAAAPSPAAHTQSFAQRKAAQLAQERVDSRLEERRTQSQSALEREPPDTGLESEEEDEQRESDLPDDDLDPEDPEALDPEDEPPSGEEEEDESDSPTLRKRLQDTQKKLREVTANRKVMEAEHAEMMGTHITIKHELQDTLRDAKQFAQAYIGGFSQEIQRIENAFNTGQVPPDQLPQARQQHYTLCQQRAQVQQQIDRLNTMEAESRKRERERQAEIARVRLSRTIPDWGRDKHAEIGEYAVSRGYSPEEFAQNLDYRFIELLHDSMLLHRAGTAVKRVQHKRKAQGPARNAPNQQRSADGRFRQAQKAFHENPGQKGRFAEMKLRELQRERRGR